MRTGNLWSFCCCSHNVIRGFCSLPLCMWGPKSSSCEHFSLLPVVLGCLLPRKLRVPLWDLTSISSVPEALRGSREGGVQFYAPRSGSKPETALWCDLQPSARAHLTIWDTTAKSHSPKKTNLEAFQVSHSGNCWHIHFPKNSGLHYTEGTKIAEFRPHICSTAATSIAFIIGFCDAG